MGIPSYYKRLIDRFPKLVEKGWTRGRAMQSDVLLMDFNCLIYQCVRGPGMPTYTRAGHDEWEKALIGAVKTYTVNVWETAGRPAKVFIGVDGVVPMAKIRQQRLRRFKSLWWAAAEREAGVRKPGEEVWYTNAITPGTEFMERLGVGLRELAAARAGWTVSDASEPGEGEQKLMTLVRGGSLGGLDGRRVTVYGLDADLIVLSLLGIATVCPGVGAWNLLREGVEFGKSSVGAPEGSFSTLNVKELLGLLVPSGLSAAEYMREYVCGMSFLGNDFLPHSLSVKIREGGHDDMCRALMELHESGRRLVRADGSVDYVACAAMLRGWADGEEAGLCDSFSHKYKGRGPPPRNDVERAMQRTQNMPLEWREEACIWSESAGLVEGWQDVYQRRWLRGVDVEQVCDEYKRGLQWIQDYYFGRPVSYSWYFPWNVPPTWGDLVEALEGGGAVAPPAVVSPVAPQEQLAMVLPMGSWGLVRAAELRGLPSRAPAFWPSRFGFFSAGRRFMWECEAEVPVISVERLRELLS